MAELLDQIYEGDHLVLEVVDDYSWFYRKTSYLNYKYFNDSQLFGSIPPYHIAHIRLFVNLDGHKIKRGLKIVASSIGDLYKHHFDIKKIMLPVGTIHSIQNMSIKFQTSLHNNSLKQQDTTSSHNIGKQMRFKGKIHFICIHSAKEILLILSGPQSLDITIDCYIESTNI